MRKRAITRRDAWWMKAPTQAKSTQNTNVVKLVSSPASQGMVSLCHLKVGAVFPSENEAKDQAVVPLAPRRCVYGSTPGYLVSHCCSRNCC